MPPRAVLVHRKTELVALLELHGSRGHAAYFLRSRGRIIEDVVDRDHEVVAAIAAVTASIPDRWRRATIERSELSRFVFEPADVIIVVGQDGLVANVAKYLDGQPVVGINPEPGRNPGVLVRHPPSAVRALLAAATSDATPVDRLAMVHAATDDGQELLALNEIYVGHASHQTARYALTPPGEPAESQASSGVIVGTGTGATGWCRSAWLERRSSLSLPDPTERRLTWFVREAWPSPATRTSRTEGELLVKEELQVTVASEELVMFGDGIESDAVILRYGQQARIGLAERRLRLIR